jgi:serine/threonine protein kinase
MNQTLSDQCSPDLVRTFTEGKSGLNSSPLSAQDRDTTAPIPCVIGRRYVTKARLGIGGYGDVLLAQGPCPDGVERWVAIKSLLLRMRHNPTAVARLQREAMLLRTLHHSGVPQIYDWLPSEFAIVLQIAKGEHLSGILDGSYGDRPSVLRAVFVALLDILCYLHDLGVCHRDVKPSNILADLTIGGAPRVTLLDFGLAARLGTNRKMAASEKPLTQSGVPIGSPRYMSPEQCRGRGVTLSSDVYSVGVMLYEAVCGHHPYQAQTAVGFLSAHLTAEPRVVLPTSRGGSSILQVALAALAKEPADRPTARVLRSALLSQRDDS